MARQPRTPAPPSSGDDEGEILPPRERERNAVAVVQEASRFTFGQDVDEAFEVAEYVTVPMIELPSGMSFIAQFIEPVKILPKLAGSRNKIKGPHWASTIRATNGEARMFTWSAVFKSEMIKTYGNANPEAVRDGDGKLDPNGSDLTDCVPKPDYVGKWYRVTRLPMKAGRDYWTYSIVLLRPKFVTYDAETGVIDQSGDVPRRAAE